jgi:two-component system, sensor histidine kinase YesM
VRKTLRPIFIKLLLSYSMVSFIPLSLVLLSLSFWGRGFILNQVDKQASQCSSELSVQIDDSLQEYLAIANRLALEKIVQYSLRIPFEEWTSDDELELYLRLYHYLSGKLNTSEVHLISWDGSMRHSTGTIAKGYDFRNYQNRALIPREILSGENGHAIRICSGKGITIWKRLPGGVLILDINMEHFDFTVEYPQFRDLYLVDREGFTILNLSRPQQRPGFAEEPQLGIVFSSEISRQPTRETLVHRADLKTGDLSLVGITDLSSSFQSLRELLDIGLLLMIAAGVLTTIISIQISRSISKPIHRIVTAMGGDSKKPVHLDLRRVRDNPHRPYAAKDELDYLMINYNRMVSTIETLIAKVRQEEKALREAERLALQAWINPHFLYNTLGSIKSMAKLGQGNAVADMVTELGKILRFAITDTGEMVSVEQSINQIRSYLWIQQMRYQDRLILHEDVDTKALQVELPKLLIQPLVENAVIHGVENSSVPIEIRIVIRASLPREGWMTIHVENTKPSGTTNPLARETGVEEKTRVGMGIENVRQRVKTVYGNDAKVEVSFLHDRTRASICVPCKRETDNAKK